MREAVQAVDEAIREAVLDWNEWREVANLLRQMRQSFECEWSCDESPSCWQWRGEPDGDWCGPCLSSHTIHNEYRAAVVQRQAALRRLIRLAKRYPAGPLRPVQRSVKMRPGAGRPRAIVLPDEEEP